MPETASPAATPATIDQLLAGLPSAEQRQEIADAAAAAAAQARATGIASIRSLTSTDEFAKTLTAAQEIATFMAGDPLIGPHLNCVIQGMTTLRLCLPAEPES